MPTSTGVTATLLVRVLRAGLDVGLLFSVDREPPSPYSSKPLHSRRLTTQRFANARPMCSKLHAFAVCPLFRTPHYRLNSARPRPNKRKWKAGKLKLLKNMKYKCTNNLNCPRVRYGPSHLCDTRRRRRANPRRTRTSSGRARQPDGGTTGAERETRSPETSDQRTTNPSAKLTFTRRPGGADRAWHSPRESPVCHPAHHLRKATTASGGPE